MNEKSGSPTYPLFLWEGNTLMCIRDQGHINKDVLPKLASNKVIQGTDSQGREVGFKFIELPKPVISELTGGKFLKADVYLKSLDKDLDLSSIMAMKYLMLNKKYNVSDSGDIFEKCIRVSIEKEAKSTGVFSKIFGIFWK